MGLSRPGEAGEPRPWRRNHWEICCWRECMLSRDPGIGRGRPVHRTARGAPRSRRSSRTRPRAGSRERGPLRPPAVQRRGRLDRARIRRCQDNGEAFERRTAADRGRDAAGSARRPAHRGRDAGSGSHGHRAGGVDACGQRRRGRGRGVAGHLVPGCRRRRGAEPRLHVGGAGAGRGGHPAVSRGRPRRATRRDRTRNGRGPRSCHGAQRRDDRRGRAHREVIHRVRSVLHLDGRASGRT